jgi:hypothetical protein
VSTSSARVSASSDRGEHVVGAGEHLAGERSAEGPEIMMANAIWWARAERRMHRPGDDHADSVASLTSERDTGRIES